MAAFDKTGIAPKVREEFEEHEGEFATVEDRVEALEDKVAENQAASTATTVAQAKDDLNALLTKLKAAGLMEADEED